jgi:hypothetical protein
VADPAPPRDDVDPAAHDLSVLPTRTPLERAFRHSVERLLQQTEAQAMALVRTGIGPEGACPPLYAALRVEDEGGKPRYVCTIHRIGLRPPPAVTEYLHMDPFTNEGHRPREAYMAALTLLMRAVDRLYPTPDRLPHWAARQAAFGFCRDALPAQIGERRYYNQTELQRWLVMAVLEKTW